MKRTHLLILFAFLFISQSCTDSAQKEASAEWPEITAETKPWTRWWWHDSAVNPKDLTANMEELQEAGFGGLEITPIYGVKGHENKALKFQREEWMKALEFTLKEGERLDLGIDLANASGWPFGGPWIQADNASKNIKFKTYSLNGGESLNEKIKLIQQPLVRAVGHQVDISEVKFPISSNTNLRELALDQVRFEKPLPLQTLMAYGENDEVLDLTDKVGEDGTLNWEAPEGNWQLYALFEGWHGKMVERAGEGGEGNVIDHFSEEATRTFLKDFDDHAGNVDISGLRAFFNDSYEVDDASGQADWTPQFFEEFEARRGYDLRTQLPALFGNDTEDTNARVLCDYRETISDLLLEKFTVVWADWSEAHGAIIRNQAHGSPANILDLYAASHIPETEGTNPMRIKMATSAGHVSGKPLIACEAATWLDEHFRANLADAKQNFDRYLSHGVNHIVYHGTPYSPQDAEWPGWMFYAAVHFAPTNSLWPDMKALNDYVANCQSFMQNSTPDNDILLYFPIYDAWSERGREMLRHFGASREDLTKDISEFLLDKGYTFDYISDKQIKQLQVEDDQIKAPGANYKTIVVPTTQYIPLATMEKLIQLAENGAKIVFEDHLPASVSGMFDLENRQKKYHELTSSLEFEKQENLSSAQIGKGEILLGDELDMMLQKVQVYPEELAGKGLWFNRVSREDGVCYFISNWGDQTIDEWVTLQRPATEAVWYNPMNRASGKAKLKNSDKSKSQVYVQLKPGESMILQFYKSDVDLEDYPVWEEQNQKYVVEGEWTVSFEKGGPTLPETYITTKLTSWTEQSDELQKFSGTASYKTTFEKPEGDAPAYILDLGEVHESATVYMNGEKLGTLLGPVFQITISTESLKPTNELEVKVSNLMANRIISMDKSGENYKKFYNINFAANKRENVGPDGLFTAVNWEPLKSGLVGPVSLSPVSETDL
ncbi:glycosyl hydrolase [Draconibacterium halophilum]|uniref:Glycoside hydrolase family 2 protein n=1 Tax=Draconibacterium halophilum TaxID=2706887 RepID=A0A6C0RBJ1_9BACT|nr:glycosyl hydrolase [Draconibacterium halophilum]QIA07449.1 glycoside hydrolase family 2 protein [Draconibacterium halophilum]